MPCFYWNHLIWRVVWSGNSVGRTASHVDDYNQGTRWWYTECLHRCLGCVLGFTLWTAQWATQEWTACAQHIWGRDMWLDIWNVIKHGTINVYHISSHQTLHSPGNNEASTLAQVLCMVNPQSKNITHWLQEKLRNAAQRTIGLSRAKSKPGIHCQGTLQVDGHLWDTSSHWG